MILDFGISLDTEEVSIDTKASKGKKGKKGKKKKVEEEVKI